MYRRITSIVVWLVCFVQTLERLVFTAILWGQVADGCVLKLEKWSCYEWLSFYINQPVGKGWSPPYIIGVWDSHACGADGYPRIWIMISCSSSRLPWLLLQDFHIFSFFRQKNMLTLSGWWLSHPSEKYEFVSFFFYFQYMESHKSHGSNHQVTTNQLC